MMKRMIVPLVFGLAGAAVLVGLGTWQTKRLFWKEAVLAEIEARIVDDPVPLSLDVDPETDKYLPVTVTGTYTARSAKVLASLKIVGAGHLLIDVMETPMGRILVQRGFVKNGEPLLAAPAGPVTITGNLHWPQEKDKFTPAPDLEKGLWFYRDTYEMAAALGTYPILVVVRESDPQQRGVTIRPVDTSGIPNDHREYAITWFSLAAVWLGMTGLFLWRIRRQTN